MKPFLTTLPNQSDFKFYDIHGVEQVDPDDMTKGPGAGVIYTFAKDDSLENAYVIGYHRNNPAANEHLQLAISIGGGLNIQDTLASNINSNVKFKIQAVEAPELMLNGDDIAGTTASVYNMTADESEWPMSFVYLHRHVQKDLEQVKELVEAINVKMAIKRQELPFLNDYGIYKLTDILNIVNVTCHQEEDDKVGANICNYLNDTTKQTIVFDDYATQPLLDDVFKKQMEDTLSIEASDELAATLPLSFSN